MSEIPAAASAHETAFDTEQTLEQLNWLTRCLSGWYRGRGNDSLMILRVRCKDYYEYRQTLERLIDKTHQAGTHVIELTMPEEGENGNSFKSRPGGSISAGYSDLEPGSKLLLKMSKLGRTDEYWPDSGRIPREFYGSNELYVGYYPQFVSVDSLAEILSRGGSLDLVEKPQDTEPAE